MPLTAKTVQAAQAREKDYKLSDEKGLFLLVKKNGSKYWRMKYRFLGKEKLLSLGVYPEVSLKEAREGLNEARGLLKKDIDPSAQRQANKLSQRISAENSFIAIANEWYETHQRDKSRSHQQRIQRCFKHDLFPVIGSKPINQITAPELLMALKRIESRGAINTAHKTKQIAGQVFRYAIATGRAERDPTPDLRGALKPTSTTHYAAITNPKDAGRLLVAIDNFEGTPVVGAGLELMALFFCRPGELRHLKWSDVNFEAQRIELVAEKTKQEHIIPLSAQALSILERLYHITGNGMYIFPSARGRSRCMSENALRTALRTMGYDNDTMTPHGFRAMARTLLDEELNYRIEWIEQQLAHNVRDANGRAYNRTKHLSQRSEMMQKWADYLDQLRAQALAGNVVTAPFRQTNR